MLTLPKTAPDPDISIIRLDFPGAITIDMEPFITVDKQGRIHFTAQDADAHGDYGGNIQLHNTDPDAYLSDWNNAKWYLEYELKTPMAKRWMVTAEISTPDKAKLNLEANKVAMPIEIEPTRPDLTWKTIPLGVIELPAGQTKLN